MLANFEAYRHIRIIKEQKPLLESIKQIHITRWAKDRLYVKHTNHSYTDWDMMTTCMARVLINGSQEDMKAK